MNSKRLHDCLMVLLALLLLPATVAAQAQTAGSAFVTTADGVKIHYLQSGPKQAAAPAILFIPGWTMPAWIWGKQIDHFSKSYRVIAMDPRGQGESSKPTEGYFPAARARDIKAVVTRLKLAPVVLVGWSMGVGEVASYVDQFGTKDIAGIVFVDDVPGAEFPAAVYKELMEFMNGFVADRRAATDSFVRSFFKKPQPEDYLKRVVEASMRTPTNTAVALLVGKFATDLRPALKKIDKPTLIMAQNGGFLNLIKAIQPQIAGSRLEIFDGAGHALFVDAADKFNAVLDEFLKALLPKP